MEHMIPHHATAVHRANICLLSAYHSQLLDLCENIVTSQATEIRQMRQFLCSWYGQCAIMLSKGAS